MTGGDFDQAAWDYARKRAQERFPLPPEAPGMAGVRAAFLTATAIGTFSFFQGLMGQTIAGLVTAVAAGLLVYSDHGMRLRRHAKEEKHVYDYFRSRSEH